MHSYYFEKYAVEHLLCMIPLVTITSIINMLALFLLFFCSIAFAKEKK